MGDRIPSLEEKAAGFDPSAREREPVRVERHMAVNVSVLDRHLGEEIPDGPINDRPRQDALGGTLNFFLNVED